MKIRNGFVSNSSSSSFIIRGAKIKTEEIIKAMDIIIDPSFKEKDLDYEVLDRLYNPLYKKGLYTTGIRNFFDGEEYGEIVIGEMLGCPNDGEVYEIPEKNDEEIINKINNLGFKVDKLNTYIQYISNDNY